VCGLCGIASRSGRWPDRELITRMTEPIAHRGPDDAGVEILGPVGLGFRRLAVLDLSPSGHQPMTNDERDVWIVLNGEIYNYVELREDLRAQGVPFNSNSDTEVALHLYRALGTGMFDRLNGMFAMAIYDVKRQSIVLARDRMGKKPLFYWDDGRRLAFASELPALRLVPGFPTEVNRLALAYYARLGFVPNWTCIHPGVFKLPPATWLRWDLSSGRTEGPTAYWGLPSVTTESGGDEASWANRIEEALWDATRIRLRSDVPIGAFLSGGVDSGLVAAAAGSAVGTGLTGLTISFPEWSDDEWPLASRTANHLGFHAIRHSVRADGASLLPKVMACFDEPFDDSSALPTYLVSQAAKEHVTVALSGDGGDEVFAGYRNHVMAWRFRCIEAVPAGVRRAIAGIFASVAAPDTRLRTAARRFGLPVGTWGFGSEVYPLADWCDSDLRPEYRLDHESLLKELDQHLESWKECAPIDQAQRRDLRFYMLDDILVKVDRMSMRHGLEVRSPFLDHRVIELALQIPPRMRVRGAENKHLLRVIARRRLPSEVAEAPKRGFSIPLRQWLFDGPKSEWFREQVCTSYGDNDLLKPMGGERLWKRARSNPMLVRALFRILAYRWWREENQVEVQVEREASQSSP
jgi:asparagine synthase (glutamine-hydrolysing)